MGSPLPYARGTKDRRWGCVKGTNDLAQNDLFGLVSQWNWHTHKKEVLATQWEELSKGQILPAGREPAVELRLKLGPGSFPPTESSFGGRGLGFQPGLWWGGTMTDMEMVWLRPLGKQPSNSTHLWQGLPPA